MGNKPMIGSRIKYIRESRGFKQEDIANAVGMEISKYSRLENDKIQKLEDDILEKIAIELGVSVADLKSQAPFIMNIASNNGTQNGYIENYYVDQKELYEKLITSQKAEIERLSKHLEQVMRLLDNRK
jgi:transcriptional regulator with XRE-family HTH domain